MITNEQVITNRCDSVDALMYAYCEFMKIKENHMLEKDKKCIEFSMRSMMLTRRPYQEDTEIEITGMIPGRNVICENNPFDIPGDVVMVPKKEFERLQVENDRLQTVNEQLKKKLAEFSPVPGYREFLTALYPGEDIEKLVWTTGRLCCGRDLRHALQVDLEYYRTCLNAQAKSNETLFKLVGFSSIEEIEDYLVNEAEADTLHEAISKMEDEVKYACDSNSSLIKYYQRDIKKWQTATGCLRPEDISIESLSYKCKSLEYELKILTGALREWKDGTGCPSPSSAKTLIESMNTALRESNRVMLKELENNIDEWQKATGCSTPEEARKLINELRDM